MSAEAGTSKPNLEDRMKKLRQLHALRVSLL